MKIQIKMKTLKLSGWLNVSSGRAFLQTGIPRIGNIFMGNDYFDDTYRHSGELKKHNGYCTDIFFGEGKKFIES